MWKAWNTKPIASRRSAVRPTSSSRTRSVPATMTSPASAVSSPAMMLSKVDFPAPDSPRIATCSPTSSLSESPSNRRRPPGSTLASDVNCRIGSCIESGVPPCANAIKHSTWRRARMSKSAVRRSFVVNLKRMFLRLACLRWNSAPGKSLYGKGLSSPRRLRTGDDQETRGVQPPPYSREEAIVNRLPEIGEHVRFDGRGSIGSCTGTVLQIYPCQDLQQPRRWVDTAFTPERWRVSVKVDDDQRLGRTKSVR